MRARHRHFNPQDAGATCALDARFLSLANAAAVDSWTDRTRNNNSPSQSSTARPTFLTNVISGQPAVDFDGANDDLFAVVTSFDTKESSLVLVVARDTAGGRTEIAFSTGDDRTTANGLSVLLRWSDNNAYYAAGDISKRATWSTSVGTQAFIASIKGGSAQEGFENGTSKNTGAPQSGTFIFPNLYFGSGRGVSSLNRYFDGKIGSASVFNSALSAPIRRRVEHAAAFSFKISCN